MRNFFWILGFFILTVCAVPCQAALFINEILADADDEDEYFTNLDWVELYNSSRDSVDLTGYYLSDDPENPQKWLIGPTTIEPLGYLYFYTTGYDLYGPGPFHTNFRLDKEGESVFLSSPDGALIDSVTFPQQFEEISYGRHEDGAKTWGYFLDPTKGAKNNTQWVEGFVSAPSVSVQGGVYSDPLQVEITPTDPDSRVYYTTDGTAPTRSSALYTTPLQLEETTILRTKAFKSGFTASKTVTNTYIFREDQVLPILSLVTDPDHLWDRNSGIYENASQHGYAWERPVSVEYILMDGSQGFQADCGIRIHGGASRKRSPKKSFRLYFRAEYGPKKLHYPLFPDTNVREFDDLVLRAGFNDSWGYDKSMQRETAILVSDQVCRRLHLDMGQVAVHGIWVELYLNGEYWGIYNPTERLKEDFMQSYYGGDVDSWNIVTDGEVSEGDTSSWRDFLDYIRTGSFISSQNWDELETVLDIENFTSYILLNIWVMNYDWPHHNWVASKEDSAIGKWRFFLWDVEYSFGSGIQGYRVDQNTVDKAQSGDVGLIFNKILQNEYYYRYFWYQVKKELDNVLSPDHVLARLNEELAIIRPAIPAEAERWGRGKTLEDWEHAARLARDFIEERTPYVLEHLRRGVGPEPVSVEEWFFY